MALAPTCAARRPPLGALALSGCQGFGVPVPQPCEPGIHTVPFRDLGARSQHVQS